MERKIKDAARELGVDRQKLIDFYRTEFKKTGANKNTPISEIDFEIIKVKFNKNATSKPVTSVTSLQTQPAQENKAENISIKSETHNEVAITDDLKLRAEILSDETSKLVAKEEVSQKQLNSTEQKMLNKADSPVGFKKYVEFLENANKNLNGLLEKRDEREKVIIEKQTAKLKEIDTLKTEWAAKIEELNSKIENIDIARAQFEKEKSAIQPRLDAVNERETELNQLAIDIANKNYSEVILALTKSMKKAQEDVHKGSVEWIDSLKEVVKEYQEQVKGLASQSLRQEIKEKELAQREELIKAREEMLDMQTKAMEEQVIEDMEYKYGNRIEELSRQQTIYEHKFERQREQLDTYKKQLDLISAQFKSADPTLITAEFSRMKAENLRLKNIAESKVERSEYDIVISERDEVLRINAELKDRLSDERIEAVRQKAKDTDELVLNYRLTQEKLAAAEASNKSLKATNSYLQDSISRLTEDKNDKEKAFEFVRFADNDRDLNDGNIQFRNPSSLCELVTYVRSRMALGDSHGKDRFYYDEKTIKTFIAGLHMSPISILQGISGTGKTSLPREFIKAITVGNNSFHDIDSHKQPKAPYRICAIQSGWRDNMDLMGYFNSFDCKYNETEFFKALYVASLPKYENTLFFIIMDEMNLSHPEHYFADFLSILEQDEPHHNITIKAREDVLPEKIKGGMVIPKNVRFIGTANHDETTNSFAPKTYDRSSLIVMPRNKDERITPTQTSYTISYEWLEQQFKIATNKYESYCDIFKKFIEDKDLIELLSKQNIGIGNRFANRQANKFICVYMACGTNPQKDLAEAVDHLMTSRLLRIIENKYGLDANKVNLFEEDYSTIFKMHFNDIEPHMASKFLKNLANQKANEE